MENYKKIVDISSDNFVSMLPEIANNIIHCDFIAFDLEFSGSGVKSYHKSVEADTFETRYGKAKANIDMYSPLQVGLCFFKWSNKRQSYTVRPYNFYLRPYTHKYLPSTVTFGSSTISFLQANHFDFNYCFANGIYTLRYTDEKYILNKIREQEGGYQEYTDDTEYQFVQTYLQTVEKWILKTKDDYQKFGLKKIIETINEDKEDDDSFPITPATPHEEKEGIDYIYTPPCSLHARLLIKQEVEKKWNKLFVSEREEDVVGVRPKNQRWRIYRHQISRDIAYIPPRSDLARGLSVPLHTNLQQGTELEKEPGMRRVIELIIASKKPLVGFECLLDIMFLIGDIYDYLSEDVGTFVDYIHQRIHTLVDMKVILKDPEIQNIFTLFPSLSSCYSVVNSSLDFQCPSINMYSDDNTVKPHDASNDAYMTGYFFIKMAYYYGLSFQDIRALSLPLIPSESSEIVSLISPITPSNYNGRDPTPFLSSFNKINLHKYPYSLPLLPEQFSSLSTSIYRMNVLLISNVPSSFKRDALRQLFDIPEMKSYQHVIYEWLDENHVLATYDSFDDAKHVMEIWKQKRIKNHSCTNLSPHDFSIGNLAIDFYYAYEQLCGVPKETIDHHKIIYDACL
ncbi:hypothetical protein WA158_004790 [Blastocystis sp. Blastoise]